MYEVITFREIVKDRRAYVKIMDVGDTRELLLLELIMVVTGEDRDAAEKIVEDNAYDVLFGAEEIDW